MSHRTSFVSLPSRRATGRAAFTCAAAVSAVLAGAVMPALSAEAQTIETSRRVQFDIAAQPLVTALQRYSEQAKVQVTAPSELVRQIQVPALQGEYDVVQALHRILDGAGLSFEFINEGAVAIRMRSDDSRSPNMQTISATWESGEDNARGSSLKVAQATETGTAETERADTTSRIQLEEVIVTGSHIRGAQNLSSPVITFDREQIEEGGFASTQQIIRSLPQNLNSISDTTVSNINGGAGWNATYDGSGANLRGLGGDATLVLVNGRRLAPAGKGSFVDISLIPVSAIERVEVLTDGASAIYGSDAVGGVINFVLRKDFEGAETRLRYGSVTDGDHHEFQAAQTVGQTWQTGHALLSYEYLDRSSLDSSERGFSPASPASQGTYKLVPEQERHGAIAMLSQRLSDRAGLEGSVLYGRRQSTSSYALAGGGRDVFTKVSQFGGTLGLNVELSRNWQGRLSGLIDQSDSELYQRLQQSGDRRGQTGNESRVWSFDAAADGALVAAPGGDVLLAVGGTARKERFVEEFTAYPAELKRDVGAVYAELLIPWVGSQNRLAALEALEMSVAARYEDYSDFGSTFNPKVGLAWLPAQGLNLRTTWGTSFKAPLLTQLNPGQQYAYIYKDYFLDGAGSPTVLTLDFNGRKLWPEESENWTLGFDFTPEALEGLSISTTYFTIDYDERISSPFDNGMDPASVLTDPAFRSVITRGADAAYLAQLVSSIPSANTLCIDYGTDSYSDISECLDAVDVVLDGRLRNLAGVRMSGLDFAVGYRLSSEVGDWRFNLQGTRLFENRRRLVPDGPITNELNRVWSPVDLRLRSSISFSRENLSVVAALNYTDSYRETRDWVLDTVQRSEVASWTTVDLTVQYLVAGGRARVWPENLSFQLNVTNLFDRGPPHVESLVGLTYDGVNANPMGRFVSAQFTARWGR